MTEADYVIVGALIILGAIDLVLIFTGRESISACVKRHKWLGRIGSTYLVLHFEHAIPNRYDPLRRWTRVLA